MIERKWPAMGAFLPAKADAVEKNLKLLLMLIFLFGVFKTYKAYGEEVQIHAAIAVTDDIMDGVRFPKQKINIKFLNIEDFPIICAKVFFNVNYYNGEVLPSNKAGKAPLVYKNVKVPANGFISFPDSSQRIRDFVQDMVPNYQVGEVEMDRPLTQCQRFRDEASDEGEGHLYAVMNTSLGEMTFYLEEKRAPQTVANFVALAKGTKIFQDPRDGVWKREPFYNGTFFHRIIKTFMAQGGDRAGNGTGRPGFAIPDEIHPDLNHDSPGTLTVSNHGPGTGGSQFMITFVKAPWLDGKHTVFGRLVSGMDVLKKIEEVGTQTGSPLEKVILKEVRFKRMSR